MCSDDDKYLRTRHTRTAPLRCTPVTFDPSCSEYIKTKPKTYTRGTRGTSQCCCVVGSFVEAQSDATSRALSMCGGAATSLTRRLFAKNSSFSVCVKGKARHKKDTHTHRHHIIERHKSLSRAFCVGIVVVFCIHASTLVKHVCWSESMPEPVPGVCEVHEMRGAA